MPDFIVYNGVKMTSHNTPALPGSNSEIIQDARAEGWGKPAEPGMIPSEQNDAKPEGDNPAGFPTTIDFANGPDLRHKG